MKKYYENINILRGMAIFLVVVGHALSLYTTSNIADFCFDFIYSFHMPLFFFISGFCAISLSYKTDWKTDGKTVLKRLKRLMLPYLFYGVVYVFLDIIGGKYTWQEFNIGRYALDLLKGDNANWQLWTLYALFVCAGLYLLLRRFLKGDSILIIALFLFIIRTIIDGIAGLPSFLFFTIISKVTSNFFFYCLGLEYRKLIESGKTIDVRSKYFIYAFIGLVLLNIFKFAYDLYLLYILTAVIGIYVFICLSYKLEKTDDVKNKFLRKCKYGCKKITSIMGDYCMPIYLFSNIFQVLVRNFLLYRFHWNIHICFIISSIVPIVLSVLIAKLIVRKNKLLKAVFLGE